MHIQIRQATTKDAALIADISRALFYNTFAAHNTPENMELFLREQFTRETLMAEVGAAGNTFLLAYGDGEPAGYVRLRENEAQPNTMEIARIYAATAMIGKGVGKALMQACVALAQEKGKRTIWLGVWEKNEHALKFYTAWGFEKVGEHDFLLGNDVQRDWIMQKKL